MEHIPHLGLDFLFDEGRAELDVQYDAATRAVTIRGGKQGFAALAHWLSLYALQPDVFYEHHHWKLLSDPRTEFTLCLIDDLKDRTNDDQPG